MKRFVKWTLLVVVSFLLIVVFTLLYARQWVPKYLSEFGVSDFDFELSDVTISKASFSNVFFRKDNNFYQASDVSIVFPWGSALKGRIAAISIDKLTLTNVPLEELIELPPKSYYDILNDLVSSGIPHIPIDRVNINKACIETLTDCGRVAIEIDQSLKLNLAFSDVSASFKLPDIDTLSGVVQVSKQDEQLFKTSVALTRPDKDLLLEGRSTWTTTEVLDLLAPDSPVNITSNGDMLELHYKAVLSPRSSSIAFDIPRTVDVSISSSTPKKSLLKSSVVFTKLEFSLIEEQDVSLLAEADFVPVDEANSSGTFSSGSISISSELELADNFIDKTEVAFREVSGNWNNYLFENISTRLVGSTLSLTEIASKDKVRATKFDPFIPFHELEFAVKSLQVMPHFKITSSDVSSKVLDGTVSAKTLHFDSSADTHHFVVQLGKIDLERLLELYPQEALKGTGKFSGKIEFKLSNGVLTIADSHIYAVAPGGELRYTKAVGSGQNPQLELVNKALKHYQYDSCTIEPELKPNGDLILKVSLTGRSPALNTNRPVNVNLNISENIPALLESFRIVRELPQAIERGIE